MKKYPNKGQRKTSEWERVQDLFQRLVEDPEFQNRVIAYRKKWGIPPNGYKKASAVWENKIGRLDDKYRRTQREKDIQLLEETEQKALKLEIKWLEYEDLKEKIHYNRPLNAAFHDIDLIIEDLRISPRWRDMVKQYILLNIVSSYVPLSVTYGMPMKGFPDTITITIDAHTTWQDMAEAWKDIENAQKRLRHSRYDKYQPYPSYENHKRMYELRQSGKSDKDIGAEMDVPYNYVSTFIKRYLDHINTK